MVDLAGSERAKQTQVCVIFFNPLRFCVTMRLLHTLLFSVLIIFWMVLLLQLSDLCDFSSLLISFHMFTEQGQRSSISSVSILLLIVFNLLNSIALLFTFLSTQYFHASCSSELTKCMPPLLTHAVLL